MYKYVTYKYLHERQGCCQTFPVVGWCRYIAHEEETWDKIIITNLHMANALTIAGISCTVSLHCINEFAFFCCSYIFFCYSFKLPTTMLNRKLCVSLAVSSMADHRHITSESQVKRGLSTVFASSNFCFFFSLSFLTLTTGPERVMRGGMCKVCSQVSCQL